MYVAHKSLSQVSQIDFRAASPDMTEPYSASDTFGAPLAIHTAQRQWLVFC
jgi:hypothetical protein